MGKKKQRNANPLLQKKYEEGRWEGIQQSTGYFMRKFEELKSTPGIGPKTVEKIQEIMFTPDKKK